MIRILPKRSQRPAVCFPDRNHVDLASEWASWMGAHIYSLCVVLFLPTIRLYSQPIKISLYSTVWGSVFCSLLFKKFKLQQLWIRLVVCSKTWKRDASPAMSACFFSKTNTLPSYGYFEWLKLNSFHHMWVLSVLCPPKDLKPMDSGYGLISAAILKSTCNPPMLGCLFSAL